MEGNSPRPSSGHHPSPETQGLGLGSRETSILTYNREPSARAEVLFIQAQRGSPARKPRRATAASRSLVPARLRHSAGDQVPRWGRTLRRPPPTLPAAESRGHSPRTVSWLPAPKVRVAPAVHSPSAPHQNLALAAHLAPGAACRARSTGSLRHGP